MIGERFSEKTAIRVVAAFEALKGVLALAVATGLLLEQGRLDRLATQLVTALHLNRWDKYPHLFISAAENLQRHHLWTVILFVCLYALLRFVEAFGLFREAKWAELFAAISGAIYIPLELREIIAGPDLINVAALVINVFVVALMLYSLRKRKRSQGLVS